MNCGIASVALTAMSCRLMAMSSLSNKLILPTPEPLTVIKMSPLRAVIFGNSVHFVTIGCTGPKSEGPVKYPMPREAVLWFSASMCCPEIKVHSSPSFLTRQASLTAFLGSNSRARSSRYPAQQFHSRYPPAFCVKRLCWQRDSLQTNQRQLDQ